MVDELYAFKCKECGWIYLEPYNPSDRFAKYPRCPDCGSKNVDIYDDELPEELEKAAEEYAEENGLL